MAKHKSKSKNMYKGVSLPTTLKNARTSKYDKMRRKMSDEHNARVAEIAPEITEAGKAMRDGKL